MGDRATLTIVAFSYFCIYLIEEYHEAILLHPSSLQEQLMYSGNCVTFEVARGFLDDITSLSKESLNGK